MTGTVTDSTNGKSRASADVLISRNRQIAGLLLRPQLYVDNVFDRKYALKGTIFSGASFGRPRAVQFRLNVGM